MIKFDPRPLFQPRVEKKFRPPTSYLNPPPKEKFRPPHLLLDNLNTVHNNSNREIVSTCMYWGGRVVKKVIPHRGTKPMFIYCSKSFSLFKKRLNASVSCMNLEMLTVIVTFGTTAVRNYTKEDCT